MPSNFQTIATAFGNQSRAEIDRTHDAGAQYFDVVGETQIKGIGTARADIVFPCRFVEKPVVAFMLELSPGIDLTDDTLMMVATASLIQWDTHINEDGSLAYEGAHVGIVIGNQDGTGAIPDQVTILNWSARGVGLRSPAGEGVDA